MPSAIFDYAEIMNSEFNQAGIMFGSFVGAKLNNLCFDAANLTGANFHSSIIQGGSFLFSIVSPLGSSDHVETRFDNSVLDSVQFDAQVISYATFTKSCIYASDVFGTRNATFESGRISRSRLNVDVEVIDQKYAAPNDVKFVNATIHDSSIAGTILKPDWKQAYEQEDEPEMTATLTFADISNLDFTGACLDNVSFYGEKISSSSFANATLHNVDFSTIMFDDVDVSGLVFSEKRLKAF
jgi:uncharacterized protein YjbI with pentapeptide repeats